MIIKDDADVTDVSLSATITKTTTIDVTNVGEEGSYTIKAYDLNGNEVSVSKNYDPNHSGFGVSSNTSNEGGSAADSELGSVYSHGEWKSEKLVVDFGDKELLSIDISFAWKNSNEKAVINFYKDGVKVGETIYDHGGSDTIDDVLTFRPSNGEPFDSIEFSAAINDNYTDHDYLIHNIAYKEVISDSTEITDDTEEVTFTIQTSNVPDPSKYDYINTFPTATVEVEDGSGNVSTYTVKLNEYGTGTLTVPSNGEDSLTATVTEVNGNFEDVNLDDASLQLTVALPESEDDSFTINEDQTYTLTTDDFGNLSDDITKVRIETLPVNGILFLAGVAISSATEISIRDIEDGKLKFEPTEDTDEDSSFDFKVSDGTNWSAQSNTTTIEITPVADTPDASINVTKVVEGTADSNNDFAVEIENGDSINNIGTSEDDIIQINKELVMNDRVELKEGDDTLILNKDINQVSLNLGEGDDEVIINGKINGTNNIDLGSEDDVIRINNIVTNNTHILGGDGKDTLYLDGNQSDYDFNWQTNNNGMIEGSITDIRGGGTIQYNQMETIVFSDGSYIGKEPEQVISTEDVYDVDLNAALNDLDGSESLTVQIEGVPDGATFNTDVLVDKGNGVWELTISEGETSIDYQDIKMTVPAGTEDVNLTIKATATEAGNGDISVETNSDAIPYSYNEINTINLSESSTNLLFTLDVSGSMNDSVRDSNGNWTTRLDIAVESIKSTIEAYKTNGETEVNLTLFNSTSKNIGWMSADDAIAYLSNLSFKYTDFGWGRSGYLIQYNNQDIDDLDSSSGTDYKDALDETMEINFNGHDADNTVAYFLSDGEPTEHENDVNSDRDSTIKDWKDYVEDNIDKLYAIGVGSGAEEDYLKIVQVQDGDEVIMVNDDSTLGDELLNTVNTTITGDVSDNIQGGDGEITIDNIVVDDVTYTKDDFPQDGISLDGDGTFKFNFDDGTYSYSAKSSEFDENAIKSFEVNSSDEDGDTTSFDITIKVDTTPNDSAASTLSFDEPNDTIDLSDITASNIKVIDLENDSSQTLNLSLDDIKDIVDSDDNELIIRGDNGDEIEFNDSENWNKAIDKTQIEGEDGTFTEYTSTTNPNISIFVDDDINTDL
nr:vWA domain-containing protein [Halarcobacter anaerophilus]